MPQVFKQHGQKHLNKVCEPNGDKQMTVITGASFYYVDKFPSQFGICN